MKAKTKTQFPAKENLPDNKVPNLLASILDAGRSNGSSHELRKLEVPQLSELITT